MKSLAAVLVEYGQPLIVEEIEYPSPGPDQVLVRQFATGVCHTQLHQIHNPRRQGPLLLGHESTGIVEAVGANVTHVKEGDHVVVTWIPRAAHRGTRPQPPTLRFRDQPITCEHGVFTWSQYSLAHEQYVVPLDKELPTDVTAILGCAVPTGVGAALNTANVQPGESVAVFGVGGVGLCIIAGAASRGAAPIIAVDLSAEKLAFAKKFGATHGINARATDPVPQIIELTGGGVDYAFDAIGLPQTAEQIIQAIRPGQLGYRAGGTAIQVGAPQEKVTLDARLLMLGEKHYIGSFGGSSRPERDFPLFMRMFREGQLDLEALVTRRYRLDQVNEAVAALERGEVLGRSIVEL